MTGLAHQTGEPDGPPALPPFGLADGVAGRAGAMPPLASDMIGAYG
jgi:crotonobetainyl-CoA:carnitine CoA-transferase CaiB-like acyl-CoA transferase